MSARWRRLKRLAGLAAALVIASSRAEGQAARQPPTHAEAPAASPDGSRIAYLSESDGAAEVYVIGSDGTGQTRLTHTPERPSQPEWSTDGGRLFFTVFADGASRIYSIGLNEAEPKLLGTVPGRAIRVSRDGKRVLYWTGSWTAMKLFESGPDGSGVRQLTDGSGVVWGARWSPDGKRIAFGDKDSTATYTFTRSTPTAPAASS